ncbi:hypothetical protein VQ056_19185 [Paenibacillus sp. JTLBN-2024]|jgi:uncharacterized lipoprotein|uniref:Uncharacterized protein n=1 Tax=Paenibacillus cookii TaxID=157839 RepID=A0ABQ4LQF3_9BACL|nr:hypothetical protein [Paenibacillus cookii]KHF36653.1 hypothetical protein CM49_00959 [Paenibacillus sp. P1XP2]GIO65494.1 hypothetical protein J21TS3_03150 [Paenibacillus cookii]HWO55170.1 hypothetical protein [Paenibacillus cookii]
MPKTWRYKILGCCLIVLLSGCSAFQSSADRGDDSPVMIDIYDPSVPEDVYSKGEITPP